jgi:hypothetical protein
MIVCGGDAAKSVVQHTPLKDTDWTSLLQMIQNKRCTPFLGAGASVPCLPTASELARQMALQYNYPIARECGDLAKVAQFVAVTTGNSLLPKMWIQQQLPMNRHPDPNDPNDIHNVLADLPFPLYVTTNYDDFMYEALSRKTCKRVRREICRWNDAIADDESVLEKQDFTLDENNPVVYHLHGSLQSVESMVLTEDDYIDFLASVSQSQELLPKQVQRAFTMHSWLFLGYSLADWNFRLIFRTSFGKKKVKVPHVSVQLAPASDGTAAAEQQEALEYLNQYFGQLDIKIYWGTCAEFATELRQRWNEHVNRGKKAAAGF